MSDPVTFDPARSQTALPDDAHGRNEAMQARAHSLLDRPLPPGYREEWARHFARTEDDAGQAGALRSILLFRLGAEWLGLPSELCGEVAEPCRIQSLPHRRDDTVLGLVNVRGELLVCISLARLLGVAEEEGRGGQLAVFRRLMVIGHEERRVAFEADEVHGIHLFHDSECRAVPATIARAMSHVTKAVLPWQDRSVGRLDETVLLDLVDRSIA